MQSRLGMGSGEPWVNLFPLLLPRIYPTEMSLSVTSLSVIYFYSFSLSSLWWQIFFSWEQSRQMLSVVFFFSHWICPSLLSVSSLSACLYPSLCRSQRTGEINRAIMHFAKTTNNFLRVFFMTGIGDKTDLIACRSICNIIKQFVLCRINYG